MSAVLSGCLAYAVCLMTPPLAMVLLVAMSRPGGAAVHGVDDLMLAAYFGGLIALLSTVGFGLVTALSARWRALPARRAAAFAAVMGVMSPMVSMALTAATAVVMMPLLRTGAWWAAAVPVAFVGALLGGVARLLERARAAG